MRKNKNLLRLGFNQLRNNIHVWTALVHRLTNRDLMMKKLLLRVGDGPAQGETVVDVEAMEIAQSPFRTPKFVVLSIDFKEGVVSKTSVVSFVDDVNSASCSCWSKSSAAV